MGRHRKTVSENSPFTGSIRHICSWLWWALGSGWYYALIGCAVLLVILGFMEACRFITETWFGFLHKTTEAVFYLAYFAALKNVLPATACFWKYWYGGQPADVVPLLSVQDTSDWDSYAVASVVGAILSILGCASQPNAPHAN